jgi:tetratricopeptide (TPR) repeat protein
MKEGAQGPSEINRGTKAREKRREAAKARLSQNGQLSRALKKIQEIAEKSADGDYIYRGEPKHYDKVSSSLYRKHSDIEPKHFKIVQDEILKLAKRYTSENKPFEILAELQHYGGATNLIDFTSDYLIALFFACEGSDFRYEDGRVILLKKTKEINGQIGLPQNPKNRVIAQKSIFVQPPSGFIKADHIVNIPKDLKQPMLDYLRKCHGIYIETIYNDLHGFIKYQNVHQSAYTELYIGRTDQSEKRYTQAIEHYTKAIEINPQMAFAYYNRGNAKSDMKNYEEALKDYKTAIQLFPDYSESFFNRANTNADLYRFQEAIDDYDEAIRLGSENAIFNKGNALVCTGRFDEALQCYRESELKEIGSAGARHNRKALEKVIDIIDDREYTIKKPEVPGGVSVWISEGENKIINIPIPISFQGRMGNTGNVPSEEGFPGGDGFVVWVQSKSM